jgi:hypothetical protein
MELFNEVDEDVIEELEPDGRLTKNELRNTRSRLRNQVNRDMRNSEKRSVDAARRLIDQASLAAQKSNYRDKRHKAAAVCYGAAALANKVLNSLNVQVPINIQPRARISDGNEPGVKAYTDFESIQIEIDTARYNTEDPVSMARLLNDVKAMVYHEGGHLLFTHTFYETCKYVHNKRGARYNEWGNFTAARKFPGDALRFGVEAGIITEETYKYHSLTIPNITEVMRAWNILEDQRMETAVVNTSPIMARYLAPLVLANVSVKGEEAMAWPWIVGRKYLPKEARDIYRELAMGTKAAPLLPRMEEIIMQYRRSNDLEEMYDLCVEFAEYIMIWVMQFASKGRPGEPGGHGTYPGGTMDSQRGNEVSPVPNPDSGDAPSQPDVDQVSRDTKTDSSDASGDQDGGGKESDNNGDPESGEGAGPAGADKKPANRDTNAYLRSIRDQLERSNLDDTRSTEVNELAADINYARNALVVPDMTRQVMDDEERKRSVEVSNTMRDVLDKLVSNSDPSWTFYQENGVLDPVGYEMAEPGEFNYWSALDGDGRVTQNLSVTMLLDTSGSMAAHDTELSVAAMGIRKACEHLEIPCTIMTFNDAVHMVVEGTDNTDYVRVSAAGGTEVFDAMQTINHYRYSKDYQLVVILTDGEWSDVNDIRMWASPGRHIMLVGFNMNPSCLVNKGADSVITIKNMSELPAKVTNALAGYFM